MSEWIEHSGDLSPVEGDVPVECQRRNGPTLGPAYASEFNWSLIARYRVVGQVANYATAPEYTGGSVSYYKVLVDKPTSGGDAYTAECNDIIEALKMNYAEGNAFKAIWRSCAARNGKAKAGYKDGLYDAEKVVFFGQRMVAQSTAK